MRPRISLREKIWVQWLSSNGCYQMGKILSVHGDLIVLSMRISCSCWYVGVGSSDNKFFFLPCSGGTCRDDINCLLNILPALTWCLVHPSPSSVGQSCWSCTATHKVHSTQLRAIGTCRKSKAANESSLLAWGSRKYIYLYIFYPTLIPFVLREHYP